MRRLAVLPLLAACTMPPAPQGNAGTVIVETTPPGALLTFRDGTTCRTPCQVAVPGPLSVTVARAGYEAMQTRLTANSPARMTLDLAPVGRTIGVEEGELPPL